MDPSNRLNEIAAQIKGGAPAEQFSKEIDRLLGTELKERDEEVESHWEETYRHVTD